MVIFEEVELALRKEMKSITDSLANGSAASYEDYKQQVGKIEGIDLSIHMLKHIIKQRLQEDTDDED